MVTQKQTRPIGYTGIRRISFYSNGRQRYIAVNHSGKRKSFYVSAKRTREQAFVAAQQYANNL